MRWFRFYSEALDDPKVQRLSPHLFRTWVNLLCLASGNKGALPGDDDLAFRLRMSVQDIAQQMDDLILAGLIDLDGKGGRFPHNWSGRQYDSDSSTARVLKHRKNKEKTERNVSCNVSVTAQNRTDSETDTESLLLTPLPPSDRPEGKEQKFVSDLKGKERGRIGRREAGSDGVRDVTRTRAEGLGLPIDEIIAAAAANKPKSLDAYVQAICRKHIRERLPSANDDLLRAAFASKPDAYYTLIRLLVMAES